MPSRVTSQPTWVLGRANARAHQILQDALAKDGMRGYDVRLLAALDELGPASQAELGRRTMIDRSDMVATVNALADRGLVSRAPDPADARRNIVSITRDGVRMLDRLDATLAAVQDAVLAPLTDRERATLVRLLAKIA